MVLQIATEFIKWGLDTKRLNLPVPWDFNVSKASSRVRLVL